MTICPFCLEDVDLRDSVIAVPDDEGDLLGGGLGAAATGGSNLSWDDEGDDVADPVGLLADVRPAPKPSGSVVVTASGRRWRVVWQRPVVTGVRRLLPTSIPNPADFGIRAAKLCPAPGCSMPLPNDLETLKTVSIAVAGVTSSSKSHLVAVVLNELLRRRGLASLGFPRVEADSASRTDAREFEWYQQLFLEGVRIEASPESAVSVSANRSHFNPFILRILPDRNDRARRGVLLLLYDISGEDLIDVAKRERYAPFLHRADGLLFLLDPIGLRGLRRRMPAAALGREGERQPRDVQNQAGMIQAIIEEIRRKENLSADAVLQAPAAFVVAKADLVAEAVEAAGRPVPSTLRRRAGLAVDASARAVGDAEVRQLLLEHDEFQLLDAAEAFTNAQFFAASALGGPEVEHEDGSWAIEPDGWGALDPFAWLLASVVGVQPVL